MNKSVVLSLIVAFLTVLCILAIQPISALFHMEAFPSGQVIAVSASVAVAAVGLLVFFKKYKY